MATGSPLKDKRQVATRPATNAQGTGNATLVITVTAAGAAPVITNNPLSAGGTVGTPFSFAIDRQTSDEVALQHYEYLRKGLEAAGIPVTPYSIALAWNSGLGAATSGRAPAASHDYAQRATNLATSFDRRGMRIVIGLR